MSLEYKKENVYENLSNEEINKMDEYVKEYMEFMSVVKTEYEGVKKVTSMLKENGFKDITEFKKLKAGDKVYFINKDKSIYASIIGSDDIEKGLTIIGAHIDSPRIDLKPMPMYENKDICMFKTQYYGGIKKYQWLTIPLSMHGVIYDKNDVKHEILIGEDESEPCFTITDLLPHLGREQLSKKASEFIDPEKMSVIIGSLKDLEQDENKRTVKSNILKILNKKYGIEEIDFARSEISFTPAFKPRYIGFDKGLISAYGHDDRICSFATVKALINSTKTKKTLVAMIVDKEEIGSVGNTSMSSNIFDMYIKKLIKLKGEKDVDLFEVYYNSKMLSADVSTAVDPCYEEVSDIQNGNIVGSGVSLEKYTGSGGKYNASDANAAYVSKVLKLFEENNVMFQMGTLGKIEKGGGGTIAYILAEKGVDVIDCGTPVLSMHAPFETVSITDTYMTYKACEVFFNKMN